MQTHNVAAGIFIGTNCLKIELVVAKKNFSEKCLKNIRASQKDKKTELNPLHSHNTWFCQGGTSWLSQRNISWNRLIKKIFKKWQITELKINMKSMFSNKTDKTLLDNIN